MRIFDMTTSARENYNDFCKKQYPEKILKIMLSAFIDLGELKTQTISGDLYKFNNIYILVDNGLIIDVWGDNSINSNTKLLSKIREVYDEAGIERSGSYIKDKKKYRDFIINNS